MSYGPRTWDVGMLYKEQDSQRRVPMRALLGIPGDVAAAPTPVVTNERQPSTLSLIAGGFSGPMGMALKQMKDLYEAPSRMRQRAKETMETVAHPSNVYRGLADPFDTQKAMAMAGMVQSGGIGGTGAGSGVALGSGPIPSSRISQRVPTAAGTAPGRPDPSLLSDMASMRQDPEFFRKASDKLQGIIPDKVMTSGDPEERFGHAQHQMVSNLRRIYEGVRPDLRERAKLWYPGGNALAHGMGKMYGVTPEAAAGTIAATSPQKNWFENVEMARRLLETQAEDPILTKGMLENFRAHGTEGLRANAGILDPYTGQRISSMPSAEAGLASVAHDTATRGRGVLELGPEGNQLGPMMIPSGKKPVDLSWSSIPFLSNAVDAARSGGNLDIISGAAGGAHKVRNFYNNLISPDPRFNDYTSDTHNIAAALLMPIGGKSPHVKTGLSGPPKSSATGMKGLYGLYADAGRQLAGELGIAPYQVQSPTWEGVRSLFPSAMKKGMEPKAEAIWAAYRKGEITLPAAQEAVIALSPTGFNKIPWAK